MVEQQFAPVPVRTVPFFDHEMVGIERLRELGARAVRRLRPGSLPLSRPAVLGAARGWRLHAAVELPLRHEGGDHLSRTADELVLQVGAWRRNLLLLPGR